MLKWGFEIMMIQTYTGLPLCLSWWRICLQCGRPGLDPLEKGKATHCSILAWRIPWTVETVGLLKSRTWLSNVHISLFKTLTELPGGLVVRIWYFHHRGWASAPVAAEAGLGPWSGSWNPASCMVLPKEKKIEVLVYYISFGVWFTKSKG